MSLDPVALNQAHGVKGLLQFVEGPSGVLFARIDSPLATADVSLYGGQVVSWQPKSEAEPVLWVSKLATYTPGKAIRGGVPICWPWFGAHPSSPKLPGHGYARLAPWSVRETSLLPDGSVRLCLAMGAHEMAARHWPYDIRLAVAITVGASLKVELTTTNCSDSDIVLTEGLHTYFKVSDIEAISIRGLEGAEYVDLTRGNARYTQEAPIRFSGEFGRIYMNNEATSVIEDPGFGRRIVVGKAGSLSTAVWNPWLEVAAKMADLGADGWRDMVCVEGANALENAVKIPAGVSHVHEAQYSVERFA